MAHYLPKCLDSILSQTFEDLEVIVMDDCSPDGTAEVLKDYDDDRVKYVRNLNNLGHLANYNKGISLTRGRYICLISPDDYFHRPYFLELQASILSANPEIGYSFCPAIAVYGEDEKEVIQYSVYSHTDCVIDGRAFLEKLLFNNIVPAASAIVRRECYQEISMFPMGMPMIGDWYLWCAFALDYDVGFWSEPMVCYRQHDASMTKQLINANVDHATEEMEMLWLIAGNAEERALTATHEKCLEAIAHHYAKHLCAANPVTSKRNMTFSDLDRSLAKFTIEGPVRDHLYAGVYRELADRHLFCNNTAQAKQFYRAAIAKSPWTLKTYGKILLTLAGRNGLLIRKFLRSLRERQAQ